MLLYVVTAKRAEALLNGDLVAETPVLQHLIAAYGASNLVWQDVTFASSYFGDASGWFFARVRVCEHKREMISFLAFFNVSRHSTVVFL